MKIFKIGPVRVRVWHDPLNPFVSAILWRGETLRLPDFVLEFSFLHRSISFDSWKKNQR